MKKAILILMSLLLSLNVAKADDALNFASGFADKALKEIVVSDISLTKKAELFEKLFNESVAMDTITKFALGRKAKSLSEGEKKEFEELFKKNVVYMWTLRFTEYQGQKIEFIDTKSSESDKDVFVNSKIIDEKKPSDPSVEVVWRLRKSGNSFKIVDIIINNISMLKTYQSEYSSFLNQNGGDIQALLNMLKNKNENYKKEMNNQK